MTDWKMAMLALTPLMVWRWLAHEVSWQQVLVDPRLRCWITLFAASILAHFANTIGAFIVIDMISAAIVLRHPAGVAQRAIGFLFICMLFFEFGFLLSERQQEGFLIAALSGIGWMQWGVLLAWSGADAVGYYSRRAGPGRGALASQRRA